MKKTLKQEVEYITTLNKRLKSSNDSLCIGILVFSIAFIVVLVIACKLDDTVQSLYTKIQKRNAAIQELEHQVYSKTYDESFTERCRRLEEESGKGFSVVTEYITQKKACNYGQVFLYSKREIEDAIKHYQLGNKENKK